jgi:hypothetical protein
VEAILNWIDHVRSADLVVIACHSQGVPVALMLVAKLIEFGVVTSARIGVCSMGECCQISSSSTLRLYIFWTNFRILELFSGFSI